MKKSGGFETEFGATQKSKKELLQVLRKQMTKQILGAQVYEPGYVEG